jgi:hypothetical protein
MDISSSDILLSLAHDFSHGHQESLTIIDWEENNLQGVIYPFLSCEEDMLLTQEKEGKKKERKEGREEGRKEGRKEGQKEGRKKGRKGKERGRELGKEGGKQQ